VDLKGAALPASRFGVAIDPEPYDERDGFSPVATLLAQFPEAIAPEQLPGPSQIARSILPDSPVQLLRFSDGKRVPLFAELDANATPGETQALILQPVVRLEPKTRYIAVVRGMKTAAGTPLKPLSGFALLRDRAVKSGSRLESEREKFEAIFATLERAGVARESLQLAWDFETGSDESVVGRLVRMRDEARGLTERELAAKEDDDRTVRVREFSQSPRRYPDLFRRIVGDFRAPSFLENGDGNRLKRGRDGAPEFDRFERFPLAIHVPACARVATAPLGVLLYGHGTFSSAVAELDRPYTRELLNRLCLVGVGTDWIGRARSDLAYFLFRILPNWNNFTEITERLQQAHVNLMTLAHLIRQKTLEAMPELQWHGKPLVDSSKLYYYGISEGGCQGVTALALSPDLNRGALNVPCGFWSMFFWRSSDFHYTRRAMQWLYPGALEEQKLMVLSQLLWDYTDPANYGGHLLHDPLPGNTTKKILYQEGINDASVPNLTTRAMARTIGLKLLEPSIEPVMGIEAAKGPLDSAYVQYDVGVRPRLGNDNIPPPQSAVHEEIRELEAVQDQLQRFFRDDGKVVDTCNGHPCLFRSRLLSAAQ
jgi:hypothetical protein